MVNINLHRAVQASDDEVDIGESVEASIEEHRGILENAGVKLTGVTALVSQPAVDGAEYPGAYQVWSQVDQAVDMWVYVTNEGVMVYVECPIGHES